MTKDWFILSRQKIKFLLGYYIILFIIGLILTLFALLQESIQMPFTMTISLISVIGGFGTALIGSSTFYLRKIYKASINKEMSSPTNEDERVRELGIFAYYFLRPLFAIGFSILIHIALKSSVHIITVKETRLDEGFIYLTLFLSFFAGFAAGDLITYIEEKSAEWVTKTFKH
jgi:hypothetical protein